MRDEAYSAGGQRIRLQVAQRSHTAHVVDEAHASRAAHRDARIRSNRGELFAQSVRGAEQHRPPRTDRHSGLQLLEQGLVGHPEQHQVDVVSEIGQRRRAERIADPVVAGIDQMHARRAALRLDHHA
jgi:hypothetical protein